MVSTRLAAALGTSRDSVVASWSHRFDRSGMRGPAASRASQHAALVGGLVEGLAVAVAAGPDQLRPGSSALRDLEKATAFAGAKLAAGGCSGFEVATLVLALRDAVLEHTDIELTRPIETLFEWLSMLALDAFATAGQRAASERAAEQLESGTPVVLLTQEIPAVFLVGAPPEDALDSIFARAMLLVVRVGAASLLVDVTGLADAGAPPVRAAMDRLLGHRRMSTVELVLVGAGGETLERWRGVARSQNVTLRDFERFDGALTHAYQRAGLNLIRRSS
jgi:hypothetical protein